jgi:mono/diheme cytochrome c family protein
MLVVPGVVLAGALAGSYVLLTGTSDRSDTVIGETTVAAGEAIYRDNCASCHGADLEGPWHHADDVLFGITKLGPGRYVGLTDYETDMPAFEGLLSDDEIRAVLLFIKQQWPPTIRARQDRMNIQ